MEDILNTEELKSIRDKVFEISGEYHILHLLICKQIKVPTEELHDFIISKLNNIKEMI